ncbi:MAG: AarF/UbiB family protein, partial [Bdellovibrionaceae bacterium]|nr:AarF/UbiB family protein [Pseudobdellovibrionaceae bacterium]
NDQIHNVVIRFIKPGVPQRIEEDHRILTEIASLVDADPELRRMQAIRLAPLVNDLSNSVRSELDLEGTMKRQRLAGETYKSVEFLSTANYKNKISFHVPQVFEGKGPSRLLVQEMVFGRKLEKEIDGSRPEHLGLQAAIAEKLAMLWLDRVLFGNGFYHADLHQGNFLVHLTDPEIRVNILDYGMSGVFPKHLQELTMILSAGIDLLEPKIIADAFWKIADPTRSQITQKELEEHIKIRCDLIRDRRHERMTLMQWTSLVSDRGLVFPADFVNLNRAMTLLDSLLERTGSQERLSTLARKLASSYPGVVHSVLRTKAGLKLGDLFHLSQTRSEPPSLKGLRCEAVFL